MKKIVRKIRAGRGGVGNPVTCLLLALCFLPLGEVDARQFFGLKVHGDFRTLEPIVSDIPSNRSGVTKEDVLNRVRQNSGNLESDRIVHDITPTTWRLI